MGVFIVWLILAVLVGVWASSRGHSGIAMFFVALIGSPLIAAIIEAIRAPNIAVLEQEKLSQGTMRKCPACAELVRAEATKCRYCGEVLAVSAPASDAPIRPSDPNACKACGASNTGGTHCGRCGEALGTGSGGATHGWGG